MEIDDTLSEAHAALGWVKWEYDWIVRLLGKGGTGEVFLKARILKLRRQVALKFLPEELSRDPQMLERFEGEAAPYSLRNFEPHARPIRINTRRGIIWL